MENMRARFTTAHGVTDRHGLITIDHKLGRRPVYVQAIGLNPRLEVHIWAYNATTITIRFATRPWLSGPPRWRRRRYVRFAWHASDI